MPLFYVYRLQFVHSTQFNMAETYEEVEGIVRIMRKKLASPNEKWNFWQFGET